MAKSRAPYCSPMAHSCSTISRAPSTLRYNSTIELQTLAISAAPFLLTVTTV